MLSQPIARGLARTASQMWRGDASGIISRLVSSINPITPTRFVQLNHFSTPLKRHSKSIVGGPQPYNTQAALPYSSIQRILRPQHNRLFTTTPTKRFVDPKTVEKQTMEKFQPTNQTSSNQKTPKKPRKWLKKIVNGIFYALTAITVVGIYKVSILIKNEGKYRAHGFIVEDSDIDYHNNMRFRQVESNIDPIQDYEEHQRTFLRDTSIVYRRIEHNKLQYKTHKELAEELQKDLISLVTPQQKEIREEKKREATQKFIESQRQRQRLRRQKRLELSIHTPDEFGNSYHDEYDKHQSKELPDDFEDDDGDDDIDPEDQFIPFYQTFSRITVPGVDTSGPVQRTAPKQEPASSTKFTSNNQQRGVDLSQSFMKQGLLPGDDKNTLKESRLASFVKGIQLPSQFTFADIVVEKEHVPSWFDRVSHSIQRIRKRCTTLIEIGSEVDLTAYKKSVYQLEDFLEDEDDWDDDRPLIQIFRPSDMLNRFIKAATEIPHYLRRSEQDLIRINQLVYDLQLDKDALKQMSPPERNRQIARMLLELEEYYGMVLEVRETVDMTSSMLHEMAHSLKRLKQFIYPLRILEKLL